MNERSAITIAAGMVATVVLAAGAIAMGITGPSQASAGSGDPQLQASPRVRTITRTVRVEQHDPTAGVVTVQGQVPNAAPSSSFDDGSDDDDSWEDEDVEDGDDDREDDDHESDGDESDGDDLDDHDDDD